MTPPVAPSGEILWFMNSVVRIAVPTAAGADGLCAIEHRVPHGDSPPLHRHATEDELFHILEGEIRFVVDGRSFRAGPGALVLAPQGSLHTYRAESPDGARFVTVTCHHDFERFIRAAARPAEHDGLPPPAGPPTPEQMAALAALAGESGITFHGPPLGGE